MPARGRRTASPPPPRLVRTARWWRPPAHRRRRWAHPIKGRRMRRRGGSGDSRNRDSCLATFLLEYAGHQNASVALHSSCRPHQALSTTFSPLPLLVLDNLPLISCLDNLPPPSCPRQPSHSFLSPTTFPLLPVLTCELRRMISWSSSLNRDSLITADREAPMPPVFMHSSTMMALRVFFTLLLMVSMSKGFRLIRSTTCNREEGGKLCGQLSHPDNAHVLDDCVSNNCLSLRNQQGAALGLPSQQPCRACCQH